MTITLEIGANLAWTIIGAVALICAAWRQWGFYAKFRDPKP